MCILTGGMESLTNAPHLMWPRKPYGFGHVNTPESINFDAFVDFHENLFMGAAAEKTIAELGLSRAAID